MWLPKTQKGVVTLLYSLCGDTVAATVTNLKKYFLFIFIGSDTRHVVTSTMVAFDISRRGSSDMSSIGAIE
jgi:hypothetical protein